MADTRATDTLILAYEGYREAQLFGALQGVFHPELDRKAEKAFSSGDYKLLVKLANSRNAKQGTPSFIEANEVFPAGSEPEMKIRKKGETWNALTLRTEKLAATPGTRLYAAALLAQN